MRQWNYSIGITIYSVLYYPQKFELIYVCLSYSEDPSSPGLRRYGNNYIYVLSGGGRKQR